MTSEDLISRQALLNKMRSHRSLFCKNRIEYTALPKDEKARVDEIDNCIAELLNVPEVCKTNSDLISRKTALDKVSAIDTSIIPFEKAKVYTDIGLETVKKILQDLPSAMPRTRLPWLRK